MRVPIVLYSERSISDKLRISRQQKGVNLMSIKAQMGALVFAMALIPAWTFAQEKNGTVSNYDESSRVVTVKGEDCEQKARSAAKMPKRKRTF